VGPYQAGGVVAQYARADELQLPEQVLFAKHIRPGSRILDLGVGAGRTSAHLAAGASRYLGVDCIPEMVEAARQRLPHLSFDVGDAADLSQHADASFDAVVFSFNGMGHLAPAERRHQCLREVARVLSPGGIFIFSLHNSASLIMLPHRRGPGILGIALGVAGAIGPNLARGVRRLASPAYWTGEGYLEVTRSPPMTVFATRPERIRGELAAAGLRLEEVIPDTHPRALGPAFVRWYYYAARRAPDALASGSP
jgi:SAM-dependent methyltransferase